MFLLTRIFFGLVDEQFCVFDEEVHVELILGLFKLVRADVQEHLIVINLALLLLYGS